MIKLSFLGRDEVHRLMADLGSKERLAEENAMLGFAETLDGSNQWRVNARKMIVARHPAGYARVFMKQNGEDRPANPRPAPGARNVDYSLAIVTANRAMAGTDAGVFVTITGRAGTTGERKLNELIAGNAFEQGKTDRCVLKNLPDVGELVSITVRSDGKGLAADWFLDSITVTRCSDSPVRFPCGKELKQGNLTVTLKPGP